MLLTKGNGLWQYLFCDFSMKKPERTDLAGDLAKNIEGLKKIFPDHDYSLLDERMVKVKNSTGI